MQEGTIGPTTKKLTRVKKKESFPVTTILLLKSTAMITIFTAMKAPKITISNPAPDMVTRMVQIETAQIEMAPLQIKMALKELMHPKMPRKEAADLV